MGENVDWLILFVGHIFKPNKSLQYIKLALFSSAGVGGCGVSLSVRVHFLPKGLFREANIAEKVPHQGCS